MGKPLNKIQIRIVADSVKWAMDKHTTLYKQQIAVSAYQAGALDVAARTERLVAVLENISKGQHGELKGEYIHRVMKQSKSAIEEYYND